MQQNLYQKITQKNRNKEAVEFVLANREMDDPNYNNPEVNKKILLQVNKDEDLTENQKQIIDSIPKEQRGVFDEEAKLKRILKQDGEINANSNANNENNLKKGVQFNFDKTEVINYNKNGKISEIKEDKLLNDLKNNKIDLTKIEDIEKVNDIFKKLKINAKMVEYNELGLKKDTDPEIMKFITNKEFVEGVDIFVPAPKDNVGDVIEDYDNDMKEENMNEEFKELEKELKSDSENEKDKKNKQNKIEDKSNKKTEEINTSSKEEKEEKNDIEITGDLEDDFVLLANGGELPIELMTEKEIKQQEEKNKKSSKENQKTGFSSSYKYITPEEVEYIRKKFLEDEDSKKNQKKGNFVSKQEFNEAINEILSSKKGKEKSQKETVMGLKKSVLDEDEFEEYELSEEEEEIPDDKNIKNEEEKKQSKEDKTKKNNIDNKKLKNIINFKNETKKNKEETNDENDDEDEEEEEDEEGYKPNIKIEYVNKEDEPDPFDKEKDRIKKKQKNKKEMKKSKSKQYEQLKAMGDLSDESFDREQLDELIHESNVIEKTKQLIETNEEEEKNDKEIEQDIDKNYIFEPKVKKDITQINEKVVNLPKAVKEQKREKVFKKKNDNEKEGKEKENEDKKEKDNGDSNNINRSRRDETKEEKKLRQKLVKMERKEKKAEKKKLKNAFKEEKVAQQKQIAQANKIVRYGLSVKDI